KQWSTPQRKPVATSNSRSIQTLDTTLGPRPTITRPSTTGCSRTDFPIRDSQGATPAAVTLQRNRIERIFLCPDKDQASTCSPPYAVFSSPDWGNCCKAA